MKYDPGHLYRLETNAGYAWEQAVVTSALAAAADAFGVDPDGAQELVKPSATSSLFRAGGVVLRAAPARHTERLAAQAAVLDDVAYERVVKPMQTRDAHYVHLDAESAWIAYTEQPGEVFDGSNCDPVVAIGEAAAFLAALGDVSAPTAPDGLERVAHAPDDWPALIERIGRYAGGAASLVAANRDALARLASSLRGLELEPTLVHDDLNHSNVIVDQGRPFFVDLEDIRLEDARIAAAHAVFKLLRHAVHTHALGRDAAREALGACAQAAGLTRDELAQYGAYRILSDLHAIVIAAEQGDPSHLYDLEKRIANLFELYDLLADDGPATR